MNEIRYELKEEHLALARSALKSGMEYIQMCIQEHDINLGRTTRKNKWWAEKMEADLQTMQIAIANLPTTK